MNLVGYILFLLSFIGIIGRVKDANAFEPVVSYSFAENKVIDDQGSSKLYLRNKAALINDADRGNVLHFSSAKKGYAVFDKQYLNLEKLTFSFFFYWEEEGARSWHQLFEVHDLQTNSNVFFTPQIGWGAKGCALISDSKEYGLYEALEAQTIPKNTWMHLAITIEDKKVKIFRNGIVLSSGYLNVPPIMIEGDSLYLGGNPNRSDNYYISARLDEIKIFNQALAENQIKALSNEVSIPDPEFAETNWQTEGQPLEITIDLASKKQTIQNFGSSDGWNTERIGKYWSEDKKEKLAELLFSKEKDELGNPKGIGLSAWRFNIGAGTSEQGDASRISIPERRTEGFLNAEGNGYNWEKQAGQQWFLRKAHQYKVHHLIGWQNSPPVAFTENNLGFREYNAPWSTILKREYFDDFGNFLADVVEHFSNEGIDFDFITPLNEPQWGWAPKSAGGTVTQEGTPWSNQDIFDVVTEIDKVFSNRNISTKLFIPEAASINKLLGGSGHADNQLNKFWNENSGMSLVGKTSFSNIVAYHSYFNDYNSNLIDIRDLLYQRAGNLDSGFELWQTEYSLLGDGYRDGYAEGYKLTEMECGLSLSKTIMADLNHANVTGWQWWTTFEKGKHGGETRYCLIEAFTKKDNSFGDYHLNKLFYTLGHFSHFIRPGMNRLLTTRSDNKTPGQQLNDVIFSTYTNNEDDELVLVAANYTEQPRRVEVFLQNASGKKIQNPSLYLTDQFNNLQRKEIDLTGNKLIVPAHSIITYTANLSSGSSINRLNEQQFSAFHNRNRNTIEVKMEEKAKVDKLILYNINGSFIDELSVHENEMIAVFSANNLTNGVYVVVAASGGFKLSKKVVVTR